MAFDDGNGTVFENLKKETVAACDTTTSDSFTPPVETGADPEQVRMLEHELNSARQELSALEAENEMLRAEIGKLESTLVSLRSRQVPARPARRVKISRLRRKNVVKTLAAKKKKTKAKGKKKSRKR
jgi:predicted RNase H-like nuclease (RuvC/YqgF family)